MPYLFDTPEQRRYMLASIGIHHVDELFGQIPGELQLKRELDLPPAASELALQQEMEQRLGQGTTSLKTCFLGGGVYDHFIPAVVDEITSRGEFYTAYTPYQAEASQGTLQAFYEYQTLISQLTGMDVSNASLYEGGTAVSESVFMAMRINGRHQKVVFAGTLHPEYKLILETYFARLGTQLVELPHTNGVIDAETCRAIVDAETTAIVIQQPNFFGCLEDVAGLTPGKRCQLDCDCSRSRRVVDSRIRRHQPRSVEETWRLRSRYCRGRGSTAGYAVAIWRAVAWHLYLPQRIRAQNAGAVDRKDDRSSRQ